MAYFAEIDPKTGIVQRVLAVPAQQEERGAAFLCNDLGLGGTWVQTSYTGRIRGRFAAPGMRYDVKRDSFIVPQPWPSWTLDGVGDWQPPIPRPPEGDWDWDEVSGTWRAA